MNQEKHEMMLEKTYDSGEEEWHCLACGRRMLIKWPPHCKKVILDVGDVYAMHSASKGLSSNAMTISVPSSHDRPGEELEDPMKDDSRLTPWLTWFEEVNFDSLWVWDKP